MKITSLQQYKNQVKESLEFPEKFWSEKANNFKWHKKWDKVLEWDFSETRSKMVSRRKT